MDLEMVGFHPLKKLSPSGLCSKYLGGGNNTGL